MRMDRTDMVNRFSCCGRCGLSLPWGPSLRQTVIALVVVFFLQLHSAIAIHVPPTFTPADLVTFRDGVAKYYRYMSIDRDHGHVYVGAMEYLYKLDAVDISQFTKSDNLSLNEAEWMINANREACVNKGKSPEFDCRNHVRSVIVNGSEIYLCSTGAYNPQDYTLNLVDLSVKKVHSRGSGRAKCPYDPNDNATCVYVRSGNPGGIPSAYSGTVADFTKLDPVIYRPELGDNGLYKLLRTVPQDSKCLYEPNFVGSFDVGDYVYFFFRETAIEYINCGRAIYSRVARVCKNDKGGSSVLENKWTTYLKARLNCSIPGEFPYYFNEIHDVFRDGDTFYGVFATNVNGLYGSAVCSFTLSDIESAFAGEFKEQMDSSSNWQRVPESKVPDPRPGKCNKASQQLPDNVLQFIKARPLMDQSVAHQGGRPLYHQKDVIFQRIAVHQQDNYLVFFLGTNQGTVYKVVQWTSGSVTQSKLLAIYKPLGDLVLPIWEMILHNDHLYIATDEKVVEFPVKQCQKYIKCTECVQDPHCLWNEGALACQPYTVGRLPSKNIRSVEAESPLSACADQCAGKSGVTERIKIAHDPVHIHCDSHCEPEGPIVWTFAGKAIDINYRRYFLTSSNGLIIFNVTYGDSGAYQCTSKAGTGYDVVLRQHTLEVTNCIEPECHWREEFQNWCNAFDDYKSQLNHWKCLKNGCIKDDNCIPDTVNQQCSVPP